METRNLIGGQWCHSSTGATFNVSNPSNDEIIAAVPAAQPIDISRAIDAASASLPEWSSLTTQERRGYLRRLTDLTCDSKDHLADLISAENGKPVSEARAEVDYGIGFLDWAADEATRIYGETVPASRADKRIYVLHQPVGVTAGIAPWNFPLAMTTRKMGPALAAGCTHIVKPASYTPLTAIALCELVVAAGIPPGVVNLVTTRGSTFGDVVMADPRVRKVSFTGSTEVGQGLVVQSASNLTRLSLELGGLAPAIVLDDADLDAAVSGCIRAKFRNSGQSCIAANRFYIHSSVYEEFRHRFVEATRKLRLGPPAEDPEIGPLIDDAAVQNMHEVVRDAVALGADVLCGGDTSDLGPGYSGRFFQPTVLDRVTDQMMAASKETFGPIAPLSSFESDDEVIRRANSEPYGLAAYVFGSDLRRLLRFSESLECGIVGINDGAPSTAQAPFGGTKLSGYGREGGKYVMSEYLETKYVALGL